MILIENEKKWAFCDHLIKCKINEEIIYPRFMIYKSMTKEYRMFIEANMVSSTGQNTISQKNLSKFNVLCPSINEQ